MNYIYTDTDFKRSLKKECGRLKKALLEISKDEKEFTAEEFKRWFRGARLKTKKDFIEIYNWLMVGHDSPIKNWKLYWNEGINGRVGAGKNDSSS